ncbi:MAG TPA: TRAP transporter large permease subunit [Stellaceae bacterium]|nr:TRAP transporter large permease subunit [Stellaceae bacterium]
MSPSEASAASTSVPGWLHGLDRVLALITEVPVAILVAVEIVVLFAGVFARYVLRAPLVWSDELASLLFLWLAMLGAVVALRRGEHMRLSAVATRVSAPCGACLATLSAMVVALFVLLILVPAYQHVQDEALITTPALGLPNSLRVLAIEVGAVLMMVVAVVRLLESASVRYAAGAVAIVMGLAIALYLARPLLMSLGNYNLLVFFVFLVALCVAIGVPIAFAFGIATIAYLALTTRVPLTIVVSRMDEGMSALILLSVPLFVFLGLLIEMTGLARSLVDFLAALLGHVRGGLAFVLLGAMYLVSGISGSKAADMAAVAPVLLPEMKRRGTPEGELIALLAASGAMSETIPPSLVLITIGSVTGVSIAALFTGGLLPALILALALGLLAYLRSGREDLSDVRRATLGQVLRAFIVAMPALALPFLIRAAVVEGIATATEVSTIGIVYTVVAGLLLSRGLDWRRLYPMLVETASLSGAILLIIGTATAMAWALTQSGFSRQLVATMSGAPGGAAGFLALSIVAFAVLGSVLEGIPAVVLFGPLLFPVARAIGLHEVHYAMVVILAMGIGLFAPPFGVGFYVACAIGRVSPDQAMSKIWPYLAALAVALVIVAAVPWLSIGFL